MKTVLIVAAHPDDEILGVGATAARHVSCGDAVYAFILGEGQTSRGAHREDTGKDVGEREGNRISGRVFRGFSRQPL